MTRLRKRFSREDARWGRLLPFAVGDSGGLAIVCQLSLKNVGSCCFLLLAARGFSLDDLSKLLNEHENASLNSWRDVFSEVCGDGSSASSFALPFTRCEQRRNASDRG